jgi:HD superfamily phosphodiesterase
MTIEFGEKDITLLAATREHFTKTMAEGNPIHDWFLHHVQQVEKWALKILPYYPNADREVVLLSVWLHDIGQQHKENHANHELYSEIEAKRFLSLSGVKEDTVEKVAHCVRTHRCKEDAKPATDEARILAAADSASHLTDIVYIYMLNAGNSRNEVLAKLERDIRDVQSLPEPLRDQLVPLQDAWRNLISIFPE